jgi:phosphoglucomutase
MIEARKAKNIAQPNDMIVKTIVTTYMIDDIAKSNDVACYNVLTGFKWIAELIKEKENKEHYVIGGEESFGLMIGDKVRDKDSVSAVALLCEMAAYEKGKGKTLYDKLIELYIEYGFYYEKLISITKKGMHGQEEIAEMMKGYRDNPPKELNGSKVAQLLDYKLQIGKKLDNGQTWKIDLPQSNVLQFILEDGSQISARPSGTEPKIKFYFSVKTELKSKEEFDEKLASLEDKINALMKDLKL